MTPHLFNLIWCWLYDVISDSQFVAELRMWIPAYKETEK